MDPEAKDGCRFSWQLWPSTHLEATRIIVPIAALYTPLKLCEDMPSPLLYDPIRCNGCGAILNPYAQIDYRSKLWTCPFCMNRNHFPPHYAENISETNLPAELIPQYTTVEYELHSSLPVGPPAFFFLVDICTAEEELDELKDSLQQTLNVLPDDALIGLITFGTYVNVHELGFNDCPKSFVFKGDKEYPTTEVQRLLNIAPSGRRGSGVAMQQQQQMLNQQGSGIGGREPAVGRFLLPIAECSFTLESILDDLQKDPWPVPSDSRVARATGAALEIAIGILELGCHRQGSRIMMFISGPPTIGQGMIVKREKTETIRSHTDLQKNAAPHFKAASKFYNGLLERATANGQTVDFFACSLDQVGLLEIKPCIEKTGGLMILGDCFSQDIFKESLRRVFSRYPDEHPDAGHLQMGLSATLEVITSREFKISGAIGPCAGLGKKGPSVSETTIGQGGTYAWSLGAITPNTTVAVYFDISNNSQTPLPSHKRRYLQFVTQYQHPNGRSRLRSTTICGAWHTEGKNLAPLASSFDQATAAILMARLAVERTETEEVPEIIRWLDRSLIRLCAKFAEYKKEEPATFHLCQEFQQYPQFMFHLRRSQFLQLFNRSPDESSYYRSILRRENVANSITMLQPTLLSYGFHGAPIPVLLDSSSVRADAILVLDTFFEVVVYHGETIAAWREQAYQDQPEHVHFKNLLLAPQGDAQLIMESRFPVPRFIVCDQHKSEGRFLISKLNPSVTHNTTDGSVGQPIFTDDVSLLVFMQHLTNLAVN
eukprot:156588_1